MMSPLPNESDVIAARVAALRSAGITDIAAYSPALPIATDPGNRKSRRNVEPALLPPAMRSALAEAATYSQSERGLGLLVLLDGDIVHHSFAEGISADTQFASQSLHKTLLAMVVVMAISEGLIASLDEPMGSFIDAWSADARGDITLRQAMQMASGLELYSMAGDDARALAINFGTQIAASALTSPALEGMRGLFTYNNANAQIVGMALECALQRAGRGSYADYLGQRVWCPLGNGPASLWLDRPGGSPHYFAGVQASLRDWAEIGELLRTGRTDDTGAHTDFADLRCGSAANPNYGLFTWLGAPADGQRRYSPANPMFVPHSAAYAIDDMAFMDGFGGQRVYVSRKARLVIARFGEVSFTFDDAVIPNIVLGGLDVAGMLPRG